MNENSIWWKRFFIVFLVTLAAIGIWTAADYGMSWDYEWHEVYGRQVFSWYSSPSANHVAVTDWMRFYGPCFETLVNITRLLFPSADGISLKGSVTFLVGLSAAIPCYIIGSSISNRRAGFLAAVTLMLTPMYYGHSFINHKDLPFAAAYAWVLASVVALLNNLVPKLKHWIVVGIAFGICLAVRVGGIMLLPTIGLAWSHLTMSNGTKFRFDLKTALRNSYLFGIQLFVAYISMMALWPFALVNPFTGPLEALRIGAAFPFTHPVLFEGQQIPANLLPTRYLFVWFKVCLPEFFILGLALALIAGIYFIVSRRSLIWNRTTAQTLIVVCGAVLPVAAILVAKSTLYDAVRHLLFIVPPLAIISALGYEFFIRKLSQWPSNALLTCIVLGWLVVLPDILALHPYQYVYFNRLFGGGLKGAAGTFETDYWATCMKDSVTWLKRHKTKLRPPFSVGGWSHPIQIAGYLTPTSINARGITYATDEATADIYLASTRWNGHFKPYKKLHTIRRQGVPLCYIFDTRPYKIAIKKQEAAASELTPSSQTEKPADTTKR